MTPMSASYHNKRCTVCGRRLTRQREYKSRNYCETHLQQFTEDIPPLWRATLTALGLFLFIIVGLLIASQVVEEPGNIARLIIGTGISLIPSLAWLLLLYRAAARRDIRLPASLPLIFALAALIAAAVTRPLLFELIDLDVWLSRTTPPNRFLGNVLINGFFHAFILYALVRYTVWHRPTFTRRTDGVLFGMAAGWGYLAMINLLFVLGQDGVSLVNGSFRLITQACAYLAPGLIMGYFLGHNRFEDMPFYYLSLGLVLSAGVNGLMLYAGNELNNIRLGLTQDGFSPWPGLVFNFAVLLFVFGAIYGLQQRNNALIRARLEQAS